VTVRIGVLGVGRIGRMLAEYTKDTVSREELVKAMAGGAELDALAHELGANG